MGGNGKENGGKGREDDGIGEHVGIKDGRRRDGKGLKKGWMYDRRTEDGRGRIGN